MSSIALKGASAFAQTFPPPLRLRRTRRRNKPARSAADEGSTRWTGGYDLFLPRRLDERVHVVEILFERAAPNRAQPVFSSRSAAGKRLLAQHVAGRRQPPRVHA